MTGDELKESLFEFLLGEEASIKIDGVGEFDREGAKAKLRELIPTSIEVKQLCGLESSVVMAAPHIHFDGWTGQFSRLAAKEFSTGRVSAYNFRDDNEFDIPVSIGRHLHVNRPTESAIAYGEERETTRAKEAYEQYVKALAQAGGKELPLDLLIEFHGHRRNERIEIATVGIDQDSANAMLDLFYENAESGPDLPEVRIEPVHRLYFSANGAKQNGVMREEIAEHALHIELPRSLRRPAPNRNRTWTLLRPIIKFAVERFTGARR